uniref:G_PROTEIN_RECEP_F1_2 domain-containing protein n=1 Tax=Schistosoma curassoni TaxID=6186 RepID=A0A183L2E9_9TREM
MKMCMIFSVTMTRSNMKRPTNSINCISMNSATFTAYLLFNLVPVFLSALFKCRNIYKYPSHFIIRHLNFLTCITAS